MTTKVKLVSNQAINIFAQDLYQRRQEAARRYAMAEKSDPFAFNRAMSHSQNGITNTRVDMMNGKQKATPCMYDADTFPSTHDVDERWAPLLRLRPQTRRVQGSRYQNVVRP